MATTIKMARTLYRGRKLYKMSSIKHLLGKHSDWVISNRLKQLSTQTKVSYKLGVCNKATLIILVITFLKCNTTGSVWSDPAY